MYLLHHNSTSAPFPRSAPGQPRLLFEPEVPHRLLDRAGRSMPNPGPCRSRGRTLMPLCDWDAEGWDSNPRWTKPPTTVFETAATGPEFPGLERNCPRRGGLRERLREKV